MEYVLINVNKLVHLCFTPLNYLSSLFSTFPEQDQKFSTTDMQVTKTLMDKLHLRIPCMIQT